ncbi:unnamed protein product [Meganyctiphanes norvegica]|uniref:Uncharacterized protein n=1 Tax=Meganyctiphanes norvegica TaxID=48144 RepID=A0AAV2SPC4_MEGNR
MGTNYIPTDNDILDAFLDTIATLHRYHFIVLLTPILPRIETYEEETGVSRRDYRNRRIYLNNIIKREALTILGYDPRIGLGIRENDLDADGVHLKDSTTQKLMEEIIVQIHDIQQQQLKKKDMKRRRIIEEKYEEQREMREAEAENKYILATNSLIKKNQQSNNHQLQNENKASSSKQNDHQQSSKLEYIPKIVKAYHPKSTDSANIREQKIAQWSENNQYQATNKDRKLQRNLEKKCWSEPYIDSDNSMDIEYKNNSASSDTEIKYSEEIEYIIEEKEEITNEKAIQTERITLIAKVSNIFSEDVTEGTQTPIITTRSASTQTPPLEQIIAEMIKAYKKPSQNNIKNNQDDSNNQEEA